MAAGLGPVPVFMRVGDSAEYQVGTFTPDLGELDSSGHARITGHRPLAALLQAVAAEIETRAGKDPGA